MKKRLPLVLFFLGLAITAGMLAWALRERRWSQPGNVTVAPGPLAPPVIACVDSSRVLEGSVEWMEAERVIRAAEDSVRERNLRNQDRIKDLERGIDDLQRMLKDGALAGVPLFAEMKTNELSAKRKWLVDLRTESAGADEEDRIAAIRGKCASDIARSMREAVDELARERQFQVVFDSSVPGYGGRWAAGMAAPSVDLTIEVINRLNLQWAMREQKEREKEPGGMD